MRIFALCYSDDGQQTKSATLPFVIDRLHIHKCLLCRKSHDTTAEELSLAIFCQSGALLNLLRLPFDDFPESWRICPKVG